MTNLKASGTKSKIISWCEFSKAFVEICGKQGQKFLPTFNWLFPLKQNQFNKFVLKQLNLLCPYLT